ncbi:MAG: hypothetical protein ACTSYR_02145 [Candidatus Odinarchaeia archaeon]
MWKKLFKKKVSELKIATAGTEQVEPDYQNLTADDIISLYLHSNTLRKQINIIVRDCVTVDLYAKPLNSSEVAKKHADKINALLRNPNKIETLEDIRGKYLRDYLLFGYGALEISPHTGPVESIHAATGYTLRLNIDKKGLFKSKEKAYYFVDPEDTSKIVGYLPFNSVVVFIYDILSDRAYGLSPVISAYNDLIADIRLSQALAKGTSDLKTGILSVNGAHENIINDLRLKLNSLFKTSKRAKVLVTNVENVQFTELSNIDTKTSLDARSKLSTRINLYGLPPFKAGTSEDVGALSAREQRDEGRTITKAILKYECKKLTKILVKERFEYDDVEITHPYITTRQDYEKSRLVSGLVEQNIITSEEAREEYLGIHGKDKNS